MTLPGAEITGVFGGIVPTGVIIVLFSGMESRSLLHSSSDRPGSSVRDVQRLIVDYAMFEKVFSIC